MCRSESGWRLVARCCGLRLGAFAAVLCGTAAIAIVLLSRSVPLVIVSGGLLGMAQMGMVPIGSVCCLELAGPTGHAVWWARFTVGYTLGVTAGTFIMGAMFSAGWDYIDGFWMAGCFNVVALVCVGAVLFMRASASTSGQGEAAC